MKIDFAKCDSCGRPLHTPICLMCDGNELDYEYRNTMIERERLALLIIDALEEEVPFTLLLTRAIY